MKGIKCTSNEVNAILAGDKSQIRLVIKNNKIAHYKQNNSGGVMSFGTCPYQIGDLVFVKERFWQFGGYDSGYDCDEPRFIGRDKITFCPEEAAKPQTLNKAWKKRAAQHMKQHQSRITLRIKDISVERLCDISRGDCMSEGCPFPNIAKETNPKEWFQEQWNATHKKPEEKFEASPWVWVYQFELIK